MAENVPSAIANESEDSLGTGGSVQILAPPKFMLRQGTSGKVSNAISEQELDESSAAPEELQSSGISLKRAAEQEEKDEDDISEPEEATCLSPVKKAAKVDEKSFEEIKPQKLLFKPSILSDVAKNLATSSSKNDRNATTSPIPKTFGISSSDSSVAQQSTDTSQRSHESAPGQNLEGIIGASSKNYFEEFLSLGKESTVKAASGSFVFGQNMSDRVMFSADSSSQESAVSDTAEEKPTTNDVASRIHNTGEEPKSLAEVAHSCSDSPGPSSPTHEKPHKSLAEAAMEYQEHMSPPKAQPARVTVVTGEEEERNVLQSNCRLFVFDTVTHSWREKGRGVLRLNDMCQSTTEGIFQSRLVMRTQGSLRVVLNTKLWPSMTLEKGNEKSLRITAMDSENNIKIYLIMAAPNDIQRLWTAIDRRIQALKRGQDKDSEGKSADEDHNADDEGGGKTEHDDELKGTEVEDDDDSVKDRCEVPDENSNANSRSTGEGRGRETTSDADDD
ncbi:ran-binding protein 3-like [Montipora capricornis]|uniref:ran-binding protein 3-like n=1 Tax=Montipora foliosa TaxID=591990 RepID=UPI0035F1BA83